LSQKHIIRIYLHHGAELDCVFLPIELNSDTGLASPESLIDDFVVGFVVG
jgi:hypothetical protein